jgi:hypothetical protein
VIRDNLLQGSWPNWDYRIWDPAVDRMFRINLATFRRPDSGYSFLAHSLIALTYGASVVRRLCPGPAAEQLFWKTTDLITKSNAFVLDHVLQMDALTAKQGMQGEIDGLAGSIRQGCSGLTAEGEQLSRRLNRLQMVEKKFRESGVPGALQHLPLLRGIFRV